MADDRLSIRLSECRLIAKDLCVLPWLSTSDSNSEFERSNVSLCFTNARSTLNVQTCTDCMKTKVFGLSTIVNLFTTDFDLLWTASKQVQDSAAAVVGYRHLSPVRV